MLIYWKTQHSKDTNFPQIDLQIQCNSSQNPSCIVYRQADPKL